jgi:F-type H+/Na+-transporting ATPase subunit alpha
LLKQPQYAPMPVEEQTMIIWVGSSGKMGEGYLDNLPVESVRRFESEFLAFMRNKYPQTGKMIREKKEFTDEIVGQLKKATDEFKAMFAAK